MRKLVFKSILLIFLLSMMPNSLAYDPLDDLMDVERAWDGQKTITNQEYEEVIDALEEKKNKVEEKKKKKFFKKISGGGTSLHSDMKPDFDIKEITPLEKKEDGELLNIPVTLLLGESNIEKGFYKVIVEKDKNEDIFFNFYQAHELKGKVKAVATDDDYGEETINFVKLLPYNEKFVKVIYGSLDYNAYTYIPFE